MSAVDFEGWASPPLVLKLGGHEYSVQPPSVEDSRYLIAAAARGEVVLGLVDKPLPPEVEAVLKKMPKGHHPALGSVWDEMAKNGLPLQTMDRMAYYATFFWARGKEYADNLATLMWAPRDFVGGGESSGPKGPRRSRSGPSTA